MKVAFLSVMAAMALPPLLPIAGDPRVEVRAVEGEILVDASGTSVDPSAFLRRLAEGSGSNLRGETALVASDPFDVHLQSRPLDSVLRALALATNTEISWEANVISIAHDHEARTLDASNLEAQSAWLRLARDFPDHEASRVARLHLGRAQERLGHEEAALAHYDAAVHPEVVSPAMEQALQAAGDLLMRRGDWAEAQRRLSKLAIRAADESVRVSARIATARALAMQGRGPEALGLLDSVDLSHPPRDQRETADRRLVRARAYLVAGDPTAALAALDQRAATHAAFGLTQEDLDLRARALDELGAPIESARAWLACASLSSGRERGEALAAAARLARAGGEDLSLLFIARLARDGAESSPSEDPNMALVERLSSEAEEHLGLAGGSAGSVEALELAWKSRGVLAPSERVHLAERCVQTIARMRSLEEAARLARTAISELDGADGTPVRAALAASYERRGMWSQAARLWSGGDP